MDVVEIFAERIREERRRRGISQEALADLSGLHRTYVGSVERAENNATLRSADRIARALGLGLGELLLPSDGGAIPEGAGRGREAGPWKLSVHLEQDAGGSLSGSGTVGRGAESVAFRVGGIPAEEDA